MSDMSQGSILTQFTMDLVGPLTTSADGNRYVAVFTDRLTKWPEAEAIPNKRVSTITKTLIKLVCRYSNIKVLITDQSQEFCNSVNMELHRRLGIDHHTTIVYHHQSNGQKERYNQTFCNAIVKCVNKEQDNWDEYIDPILLRYRSKHLKRAKKSPFELAFGRQPTLHIEEKFPVSKPAGDDEQLATRINSEINLCNLQQQTKVNITDEQQKRKSSFAEHHQPPSYKVGDLVVLNLGDMVAPKWTGPHTIEEVHPKGSFRLTGFKPLFNATRIRPYLQARRHPSSSSSTPSPCVSLPPSKRRRSSSDCEVIGFTLPPPLIFNSVDEEWQADRAKRLGFRVQENLKTSPGSLCNAIVKCVNKEQDNRDEYIDPILLRYQSTHHKRTTKSPFELAFGRQPTLLIEENFPVSKPAGDDEQLATRINSEINLCNLQQQTKVNITDEQQKLKSSFAEHHQPPSYKVGDLVLLNLGDMVAPQWTGPHTIEEVHPIGSFRLTGFKPLFNATRIRPYLQARRHPSSSSSTPSPCVSLPPSKRRRSSSDCEVIGFTQPPPLTFNSVDEEWQADRAKWLGFRVQENLKTSPSSQIIDYEEEPKNPISIIGDGNCFFRSISYFLTGAQTNHRILRDLTVQYMRDNNETFSNVAAQPNYAYTSNIAQLGEYATDVEITAIASLLSTPIWTFSPFGHRCRWQCYTPLPNVPSIFAPSGKAMYLKNMREHFEPVVKL